jgi:hypothetical protein
MRWTTSGLEAKTALMARGDDEHDGHRRPRPRPPVPERRAAEEGHDDGLTHTQFVEALRDIDGLIDVTGGNSDRPNFHLRDKPFLHFHADAGGGGIYADVKLGGGTGADFEPVWASSAADRADLLLRIHRHVRRATRR